MIECGGAVAFEGERHGRKCISSRPQKDVVLDARLEGDGQAILGGKQKMNHRVE